MYRHIEKDEKKLTDEEKDLRRENAKLKKQVDELKFDKELLQKLIDKREKDTAKEIYAQVLEWSPVGENYHWFITTLENWLKEKYGVEVE